MANLGLTPISRALISVSDKTGLAELGKFLEARKVDILSTGGSAKALSEAGVGVREVAAYTGFPELMEGRVKTLHPLIHGAILARRDRAEDVAAMAEHGIQPIELVVINLYPFEATVAAGAPLAACLENIDIGGPALIRAAAKNHDFVTVVTDPADYAAVMAEISANGGATTLALRRRLAAAAFARTAAYDAAVGAWFARRQGETFPPRIVVAGARRQRLRYGENPHQEAAFYATGAAHPGVATATQLQGKALSFNNLSDTDAAFELVAEFDRPAVAIIKHANPCGVAQAATPAEAYEKALACDPLSAYGGVIALNRPLDEAVAAAIAERFVEVVIAPDADGPARAALAAKEDLRLLVTGAMPGPDAAEVSLRSLAGGFLLQTPDAARLEAGDLKVVTKRTPTDAEMTDLVFAFTVVKHVKSNAVVFARGGATVGIGAGQMSRVDAVRIAVWKAKEAAENAGEGTPRTAGSVIASDAFFPFADGLIAAAEAGAKAVIQPGGSKRDEEVIAAADEAGLAMVFTGIRHFRH